MFPFFLPPDVSLSPFFTCPVWINLPPRGVSTCEILYFQTPSGYQIGYMYTRPDSIPAQTWFSKNLNPSWFLQLQRLRKGCSLFLFYFQMPRFGFFFSPNIAPNPPPIFNMALNSYWITLKVWPQLLLLLLF